jgi:hypothetical protein
MPQSILLKAKGLHTYPNPLSAIPDGALEVAKNLVIDREDTAEPRRGFSEIEYPLGLSSDNRPDQLIVYGDDELIAHYGLGTDPTRLAFFMFEQEFSAVISSGSNVVSDILSTNGYYSSAVVKAVVIETIFSGDQTLGSNTLTNVLTTQGLYVGLQVGGRGIPPGTTITAISGTGPYTVTISNNALFTAVGNTITASNENLINLPTDTRAVVINNNNLVLDQNSSYTSRTLNFDPTDVNTTTDLITIPNHGLLDGQTVQFTSSGTLPAPLATSTLYYIVQSNNDTFRLSTVANGSGINLTSQGTGVHTMTVRDLFTIGGWIDYPGVFEKPEGNIKIRFAEQNNSLFLTTKDGIRKLDNIEGIRLKATVTDGSNIITNVDVLDIHPGELVSGPGIPDGSIVTDLLSDTSFEIDNNVSLPTGVVSASDQLIFVQPRLAGISYALDGEAVLTTDFSGFLPNDRAVQYFIVWGYKDANNRIARGAPSSVLGIVVSNNTGESKNVQIKATIPNDITPAHFYQVYRSGFSANAASIPPSESRLIYEANPTFTDIINGIITFNDNVPEELRTGEILYTSESQEGILLGNFPPPFGTDIASFKNSLFISNIKTKHTLGLTILSVSGNFSILGNTDNSTPFKALTISNPVLNITGDVTSGSPLIANISPTDMGSIAIGMTITGTGIPEGTKVASYDSPSSIRITKNATATNLAVSLSLSITGVSQGQLVFGTPIGSGAKLVDTFNEFIITSNTVNASPMLFNLSTTAGLKEGQPVSAASGIPAGTLIEKVYAGKSISFVENNTDDITDTFTLNGHGLENGNVVTFEGSSLPTGISTGTFYYIISASANTFQISTTFGGSALNFTTTGAGSIVLSPQVRMTDNASASVSGLVVTFGAGFKLDTPSTATTTGATITFKNGTGGIEVNDTLTVAGVTYTAGAYEDYTGVNRQFRVYSHGTPAQNITNTALSLIRVVNRQGSAIGSTDVYARYTSSINSLPGEIVFEATDFLGGIFYATANNVASGLAYTPALPAAGGTTVFSENNELGNGLAYSKFDLPEAFPLGYVQQIGNEKSQTIRIIPLRDSLFNLKEDGVFRVAGEDPESFSNSLFDNTITLAAPESVAKLSNIIFALSTEGVVAITDSNAETVSRPIENLILDIFEQDTTKVRTLSFAYAYESEKKYILFTIKQFSDSYATQAFVYNTFTNSWTTWELTRTCGIVLPFDDLAYLGNHDSNTVKVERKSRNYTDYIDDSIDVSIEFVTGVLTAGSNQITLILPDTTHLSLGQTVSGTGIPDGAKISNINNNFTITLNKAATISGTVDLQFENGSLIRLANTLSTAAGDVIYQNDGRFSIILEVNSDKSTILTRNPINSWTAGDANVLKAIDSELRYAPQTCGNPSSIKQVTEFIAMFQTPFFDKVDISFESDISGGKETVELEGQIGGVLWGLYPWGEVVWGGVVRAVPLRTYVPRDKQRNTQLNITISHREAYAFYRLSGIQLYFNTGNQRVRR